MIVIFTGPTLSPKQLADRPGWLIQPPAKRGDIYNAMRLKPRIIGIVDGFFQGELSIWHKEILWAMSQGVHVFGCSSMGALRAAELHQFGMRGVGQIFESYRDGELEDDDEVALIHGPEDMDYMALSEPMVNIRATLAKATREGVLPAELARRLLETAKLTDYRERNWEALLSQPKASKKQRTQLKGFTDWLHDGKVDAKREDALAMLSEIEAFAASDPDAMQVDFTFEYTHLWHSVVEDAGSIPVTAIPPGDIPAGAGILNELRLQPHTYYDVQREALLRLLSVKEQRARGYTVSSQELKDRIRDFRLSNSLGKQRKLDAWLAKNGLDEAGLQRLAYDNALVDQLLIEAEGELDDHMLSALRETGQFAALRKRAGKKARFARKLKSDRDDDQDYAAGRLQLAAWHFETCLEQDIPTDLNAYALSIGLRSADELFELLRVEYQYRQLKEGKAN